MLIPSTNKTKLATLNDHDYFFFSGIPYVKIIPDKEKPETFYVLRIFLWNKDEDQTSHIPVTRRNRRWYTPGEEYVPKYKQMQKEAELPQPEEIGSEALVEIALLEAA